MRAIDHQHSWSSKLSNEEELELKFGKLLVEFDESEAYEQDGAMLYKRGGKYFYLESSGCSCWDGDWTGYEFTLTELRRWAKNKNLDSYDKAPIAVAKWVNENLGKASK